MDAQITQADYGLPTNKRWRGKSLSTQLQLALDNLAFLAKVKRKDGESYITEVKAATMRAKILNLMISRKDLKKVEKLRAEVLKLKGEVSRLTERLAILAVKPTTQISEVASVVDALEKYEIKKRQGGL